ncbi:SDR family NAD(P)-dependent oxidoreductase [Novosphingobium mangrovi (ex Huang et al. 2023)]|uniref:SDR family NAD(P)-dependent oxidoreductase n=1 Tax=Novosphingobium mangrovi (ex Huang et al. 2023) TaxID=2976432 RepID=A0ABT2I4A0_9SPHN|nr:SDR family NAD(P)-dependent oxidoreductase [Novosphingobium mangrovi (ex Huang et al. 2023)]MCT2399636.1 SDR family NAD(P)-dependent oxidoreductase [Novosphingobium mangrovi (ex Huang et al. 2023)]
MDLERYGPWALVVGGSEGVGAECARQLAAGGFDLVLTARKIEPLEALAQELRGAGRQVRVVSADLARPDALERVREATDNIEVGLLFYNAGANNTRGNFVDLPAEVTRSVIAINVIGQTEFARHYGALMKPRGKGGIVLTGSLSGYMGSPSLAAYTAAKAFSRTFTEALWAECSAFGVDVLHFVIGFTATPAMERLGIDVSKAEDPGAVARKALANIANGPVVIAGGEDNLERARQRSVVDGRGAAIRAMATPSREDMPKT